MIKKVFLILFCFLYSVSAVNAFCPLADASLKNNRPMQAWYYYKNCADTFDDSQSQFYIASNYLNGSDYAPQDLHQAWNYFRRAAENGYAPAQRELAKLIDALEDMGKDGRQALAEYQAQWQEKNATQLPALSALAWAMLAAERAENKWFYKAEPQTDQEAVRLLPALRAKGNTKQAEKQAIAFKQQQLMRQARDLLTDRAYQDFEAIIYPNKNVGKVKPKMSRSAAIENLKQIKMNNNK